MKVAVLGDGGWGTANALVLSGYGHEVTVWGHSADYVDYMRVTRRNPRYLPGVALPEAIRWTSDRAEAVAGGCSDGLGFGDNTRAASSATPTPKSTSGDD